MAPLRGRTLEEQFQPSSRIFVGDASTRLDAGGLSALAAAMGLARRSSASTRGVRVTQLVFWIVLGSSVAAIAGVLLSWGRPATRIWPPPGRSSWQAWLSWLFIEITMAGPLVLGVLDWNGWILPSWMRALGLILVPIGFGLGLAAMRQLTVAASFGLEGRLVTSGIYRYSRNPQCVAFIAGYLGFALLSNSLPTLVTAMLLGVELGLSPFAEEPWLRERFGQPYDDYASRVPRFLGRPGPAS